MSPFVGGGIYWYGPREAVGIGPGMLVALFYIGPNNLGIMCPLMSFGGREG